MAIEKVETLVVGAGQAGVTMSEHLSNRGVPPVPSLIWSLKTIVLLGRFDRGKSTRRVPRQSSPSHYQGVAPKS
jgi:hypothetical protein